MATITKDTFLKCLKKSGVLDEDQTAKWLSRQGSNGPKDMALSLVREKLLTLWQAKMILSGRHRLTMGSYRLLSRTSRNEFGDRFEAIHLQLGRKVSIQILPSGLAKQQKVKDAFLAQSSAIAHLDHPNLVHVYDIDEESTRLYVVNEFTEGETLAELSNRSISEKELASIVKGCLSGLKYAHQHDVIHGGIDPESIVLTKTGETKIQNLGLVAVRDGLAGESQTHLPVGDFEALGSITANLVKKVVPTESAAWDSLKPLLTTIAANSDATESSLDEWISTHDDSVHELDVANELLTTSMAEEDTEEQAGGFDQPISGLAATPIAKPTTQSDDEPASEAEEELGFFASLARNNPVGLITAASLVCLLMIGGTIFGATKMMATPTIADGDAARASLNPVVDNSKAKTKRNQRQKNQRQKKKREKVERPNFDTKDSLLSNADRPDDDQTLDPEANKRRIAAMFGNGESQNKPSVDTAETNASAADSVDSEVDNKLVDTTTPDHPATDKPASENTVAANETSKSADMQDTKVSEVAKNSAKPDNIQKVATTPKTIAAGTNPFEKFTRTIQLPPSTDTKQAKIGDLILERKHLLGAELVSGPEISKSKIAFELNRSSADKQTWEIGYRKRKKDGFIVVAKLQKTAEELLFNWEPVVTEHEGANYLRNCVIKLSTPNDSHWLTLRTPIKIDGFLLNQESTIVSVPLDIPWPPALETIKITAAALRVKVDDKWDGVMYPPVISRNESAKMFFTERQERFLWVDITAGMKKKMQLNAALVMHPDPTRAPQPIQNIGVISGLANGFQNQGTTLQNNYDQIKDMKTEDARKAGIITKKQSWEDFNAIKKQLREAAQANLNRGEQFSHFEKVIPQLFDKPIPITVSFELGQHRTVLAQSVEQATAPKKK